MASLAAEHPTLVAVLASAPACDEAMDRTEAAACRVAPGEVMLVGETGQKGLDAIRAADPDAVVEGVSDGWACWILEGHDARDAFARLSELALPDEGFVQGEVTRVAVRVLVRGDRLMLLVPAMWSDHLHRRIRAECPEVTA